ASRPRHGASQLPGSSPVGPLFRPPSPWISPFHCGRNFPSQFQCLSLLPSHPPTPAGLGFLKPPSGSLVGKISWRRVWQPTPVSLSGESHGQRSL
ncbi:unnamed protein product, partial [Rangifer tarandus platyrhynchus]